MGTTGIPSYVESGLSASQYLIKKELPRLVNEVLAYNIKGSCLFAAIRVDDGVTALVMPYRVSRGELRYKAMTESMGPSIYGASKRVLEALSPADELARPHNKSLERLAKARVKKLEAHTRRKRPARPRKNKLVVKREKRLSRRFGRSTMGRPKLNVRVVPQLAQKTAHYRHDFLHDRELRRRPLVMADFQKRRKVRAAAIWRCVVQRSSGSTYESITAWRAKAREALGVEHLMKKVLTDGREIQLKEDRGPMYSIGGSTYRPRKLLVEKDGRKVRYRSLDDVGLASYTLRARIWFADIEAVDGMPIDQFAEHHGLSPS